MKWRARLSVRREPTGESIVPRCQPRAGGSLEREALSALRSALGKSIVLARVRAGVSGKSIAPRSFRARALGESIVPRFFRGGLLGKSIGKNDRLADALSESFGTNDRLAEGNDRLAEGNDRLAGTRSPLSLARSKEQGALRAHESPRSPRSHTLSRRPSATPSNAPRLASGKQASYIRAMRLAEDYAEPDAARALKRIARRRLSVATSQPIVALVACLVACNDKPPVPAPPRPVAVEAPPPPPSASATTAPSPATPSAPSAEPPAPRDARPDAWSVPVEGIRGRLVVVRLADSEGHKQAGIDLELENVRDRADAIQLAWEGASSMLDFTLEDEAGHALPKLALGGNEAFVPTRLAVPPGAVLRLPISHGLYESAKLVRPTSFEGWEIGPSTPKKVYLRATFAPPVSKQKSVPLWTGPIALPRVALP